MNKYDSELQLLLQAACSENVWMIHIVESESENFIDPGGNCSNCDCTTKYEKKQLTNEIRKIKMFSINVK